MSEQIAVRLPDDLAASLGRLVAPHGRFVSKADAVRSAIEELVDREARRRIGEAIVEGYRRVPPSEEGEALATAEAIRSIEEEPW